MPIRQIDLPKYDGCKTISIRLAWWFWPYIRLRLWFGPIEEDEMERIYNTAARIVFGK